MTEIIAGRLSLKLFACDEVIVKDLFGLELHAHSLYMQVSVHIHIISFQRIIRFCTTLVKA